MYPKQIPGETNLTYIKALETEIVNYTELKLAMEDYMGDYLSRIPDFYMYYESIKERINQKKTRLKQVLAEDMCINCGDLTIIWFEPKYNGYMGRCDTCNSNWKES
jgi:hypothetical protein